MHVHWSRDQIASRWESLEQMEHWTRQCRQSLFDVAGDYRTEVVGSLFCVQWYPSPGSMIVSMTKLGSPDKYPDNGKTSCLQEILNYFLLLAHGLSLCCLSSVRPKN